MSYYRVKVVLEEVNDERIVGRGSLSYSARDDQDARWGAVCLALRVADAIARSNDGQAENRGGSGNVDPSSELINAIQGS